MADPVGIITSTLHASRRIYETLKTINDAPEEIQTLQLQASMVESFLPSVLEMIAHDQTHSSLSRPEQLQILFTQSQQFQDAAQTFLTKVAKNSSSDLRSRIKYTIHASSGRELQQKFQGLLITLIAITTSRTARMVTVISPQPQNIPHDDLAASPSVAVSSSRSSYSNRMLDVLPPTAEDRSTSADTPILSNNEAVLRPRPVSTQYIIAFYVKRRVRMLGFAEFWQAERVFNMTPNDWAKILVDTSTYKTVKTHADDQKWITVCETVVRSALDTDVHYIVAFHQNERVRMLGCNTREDSETVYNIISEQWARVLVSITDNQLQKSSGHDQWVSVCLAQVRSTPLSSVAYMIGMYCGDRVILIGAATEEDAEAAYAQIPKDPGKVLMQQPMNDILLAHGVGTFIELCETVLRSAPLSVPESHRTSQGDAPYYIVAFHMKGRCRILGAANRADAEALYERIPNEWAKLVIQMPENQVLLSDGGTRWLEGCKAIISSTQIPYANIGYMLAFDEPGGIRVLGAAALEDAEMAYNLVSKMFAKTLTKVPDNQAQKRDGSDRSIRSCEAEVYAISSTACHLSPLDRPQYLIAYHRDGRIIVFSSASQEDALATYKQISKQWCKVLMRAPANHAIKSHGGDEWIDVCQAALNSISMVATRIAPRSVPHFLIAFHERDRVRMISCTCREDAQDVYKQISAQWAKVLMSVPSNQILDSHGDRRWVELCETELHAITSFSGVPGMHNSRIQR